MVVVNGFGIEVKSDSYPAPKEFIRDGAYYVAMPNNTTYSLTLINNKDVRADAYVSIDGESIGGWVLRPYSRVNVERHGDIARKLTFFSETSGEAAGAGVTPGLAENGLLKVVFKPEKKAAYVRMPSPSLYRARGVSPRRQDYGRDGRAAPQAQSRNESYRGDRAAPPSASMQSTRGYDRMESAALTNSARQSSGDRYSSGVTLLGDESRQRFESTTALRDDQIDHANITEIIVRLVVEGPRYTKIPPRIERATSYPPRLG